MKNIEIKNRFTGAVLFSCALPPEIAAQSASRQLGYAVRQAYLSYANLAYANLAGVNLAYADLAYANLAGARNVPAGVAAKEPPDGR